MSRMPRSVARAVLPLMVVTIAACGASSPDGPRVIEVPDDHGTIQDAVDAAQSGDLVLLAPGVYREAITVRTPGIVIRGTDRNDVILDGSHDLVNGIQVLADGVAVENLTIRNYRQNGLLFNGASAETRGGSYELYGTADFVLSGYRSAYVTTYNNGLYGIYAFASRDGLIEHSYASGHPDSGIYVGQCKPCNVVISDSTAENNAIGYYGTNASGDVYVINNEFRGNRLGVAPNSQDMELLAPQSETVVAGNLVVDNDNPDAPAILEGFFGGGIAVGGGTENLILRNRVSDHDGYGIGLVALNDYDPVGNRVVENVVVDNRLDLYFESRSTSSESESLDNCFTANDFITSAPPDIEVLMPCPPDSGAERFGAAVVSLPPPPPSIDYRSVVEPGPMTTMSGDVRSIPDTPASVPPFPDLDQIVVPPET